MTMRDTASQSDTLPSALAARTQIIARTAGFCYLAIFALALFANFFVLNWLLLEADTRTIADRIFDAEPLVRWGIASFVAVLAFDIVAGWALFIVLRPANSDLSLLALLLRLSYTIAHNCNRYRDRK